MALGELQIAAVGAITQPTDGVVTVTVGSELAPTDTAPLTDHGLYHPLDLPELGSVMLAHGTHHMRHTPGGTSYRVGLLAPRAGQTVESTAARATATLTFSGNPAAGDTLTVGPSSLFVTARSLTFVASLTLGVGNEVLIGANQDATLTNLQKFINGTGQNGTDYWLGTFSSPTYDPDYWQDVVGVEISAIDTTANTATFRATAYGTIGNTYGSTESSGVLAFGGLV